LNLKEVYISFDLTSQLIIKYNNREFPRLPIRDCHFFACPARDCYQQKNRQSLPSPALLSQGFASLRYTLGYQDDAPLELGVGTKWTVGFTEGRQSEDNGVQPVGGKEG